MKNSEKSAKRLSRMVDILGLLSRNERGCSRQFLAEEFGVCVETITRDVQSMSREFPIRYDYNTGTYRFREGFSFKDVNLSPEEIRALLMCRLIALNLGELVSGPIESLMKKLKMGIGKKSGQMLEKVSASYAFDTEQMGNVPKSSNRLETIQVAVEKNMTLAIKYMSGANVSARTIDPYGLFFRMGVWYVVACNHKDREIDILPFHRITDVKKTDKSFRTPTGFSVDDYIKAHPKKAHKEDLKELRIMLEWLDNLYILKELNSRKRYFIREKEAVIWRNEEIREIQTVINERNSEIRRLEKMKDEGKKIDTRLYEELKALNNAAATEVEEHISMIDVLRTDLSYGLRWDTRRNLSIKEVEGILKEAGSRISKISVNEEFKRSVSHLFPMEVYNRKKEIEKEIAKLESMSKG